MLLTDWTVDYGSGPRPVSIPHVWGLDVSTQWEGPALYSCRVKVDQPWLVFRGVSYEAVVSVNGLEVLRHRGIWDAFSVDLGAWLGQEVELTVKVTKNGGAAFPVRDVLSGFLPYVFHTFGGIFQPVELAAEPVLELPAAPNRLKVDGTNIYVDGQSFSPRGILTWGWYPETADPNPPLEVIQNELDQIQSLGFNTVKFCLWMPSHTFLEEMHRRGLMAWLELPLWDPAEEHVNKMEEEILRIVRQYRHHPNILMWTIGCELSDSTTPEFRKRMVEKVMELTGCPLVKDNSGGAEMYGGEPVEFGTFDDFHPYCDTHFYPVVLDSLTHGPRAKRPILLGEFNDYDVARDISRVAKDQPYWASHSADLNPQGVRWQHDLPDIVDAWKDDPRLPELQEKSRRQGAFIRAFVQRQVAQRADFTGFVLTGWRDTPISNAGIVDDWGDLRYTKEEFDWNDDLVIFTTSRRSPPWVHGGNRPAWNDPYCHWEDRFSLLIGCRTTKAIKGELTVSFLGQTQSFEVDLPEFGVQTVGEVFGKSSGLTFFELVIEFADRSHTIRQFPVPRPPKKLPFASDDPRQLFTDAVFEGGELCLSTNPNSTEPGLIFLVDEGTIPMPFWRENCQDTKLDLPFETLIGVSPDRAICPVWLNTRFKDYEVLFNRVDTRTFKEHPIIVRAGRQIITTLRPFGGLGIQTTGLTRNPAGWRLIQMLEKLIQQNEAAG